MWRCANWPVGQLRALMTAGKTKHLTAAGQITEYSHVIVVSPGSVSLALK